MKARTIIAAVLLMAAVAANAKEKQQLWPDGTPMDPWFADTAKVDVAALGRQYVITDYGVRGGDSTALQTEAIQKVIDTAASQGGGVVVVPRGTFLTGSLFFRPGTHLHLREGARLKGSDAITHYKIVKTRLEGQTLNYFAASYRTDETVLGLARRIKVEEDPAATARFPHRQARVIITLKDGRVFDEITLDSCDNSDEEQIVAKFEAAVPFYDAERRARIIDLVKNIDAQPDVHALAKLLS